MTVLYISTILPLRLKIGTIYLEILQIKSYYYLIQLILWI